MATEQKSLDLKLFLKLLTPSASSLSFCVLVSLALSIGVVSFSHYQSSSLRLQYLYYQSHTNAGSGHLSNSLLQNSFISNLPLYFFWAIVGVIVYLIATDVVRAIQSTVEIEHELNYVNVDRKSLIKTASLQLLIRVVVIAVWLPYLFFFFRKVVPYVVTVALVSTSGQAILIPAYLILGVLVMSLAIHLNFILLRLIFLRPRLF